MRKWMVAVALTGLVSGCATIGQTPTQQERLVLDSAGDIGAVACAAGRTQLKPADLVKAQKAVTAAQTVLKDPEPKLSDIQAALAEGVDEQWASVSAVLVQRLKKRLGDANVLPVDSLGYRAAVEALDACSAALS